jgi:ABC-2 type transport system ATP-binding protein
MIEVEGLSKVFGLRIAVENITFHAERGEILGFLGPNGAGKTTTMRILAGYMPPTSGEARVAGYDVVDQSLEVRKRVGYLPETVPLYPDMTVFEYLKFMADLRHVENAEDRVDEVLELVHMEERSDSFISSLSKGMRQRIGLAQAIIHKPDVLILDEPTIGLDPAQIIDVRNLIRELGQDHTIMLSTHILSEAQQVCNRVLIINKGKIVVEDTPESLQSRLSGSHRVSVQVSGDDTGLIETVKSIQGVENVNPMQPGHFEFETLPNLDVRPEVARAIVSAGFDLVDFRSNTLSLEDIFIELTRDEPQLPNMDEEYHHDTLNVSEPEYERGND